MAFTQIHMMTVYSIAVALVLALTYVSGDDVILQKKSGRNRMDMDRFAMDNRPVKRPFCNAFAGCGRKRSVEPMASLLELNSEPAVEELNKQIRSEAKLWEAIQEARAEVERQRQEREAVMSRSMPFDLGLSSYRKKRAARAFEQKLSEQRSGELFEKR